MVLRNGVGKNEQDILLQLNRKIGAPYLAHATARAFVGMGKHSLIHVIH